MYVRRLVLAEEGWHDAAGGKGIQYVPSRIRRAGREVSGAAADPCRARRPPLMAHRRPRLRHQHASDASDASSALAQVAHAKGDGMVDTVTAKCAGETRQPAQHDSFTTCIGIHDCTECSKHTPYIHVDGAVGERRPKSWSRAQLPRPSSNRTSGLQHDPPVRRSRYSVRSTIHNFNLVSSFFRHPSIISPCPVPDSAALVIKLSLCQPPTTPNQKAAISSWTQNRTNHHAHGMPQMARGRAAPCPIEVIRLV
ncbi:hypothetical protein X797_007764 [Metarhizium robertsii]|uniref:Uncharacterized protein n=1 Tax=Metarhizium robertsii TaxID=568076 RepID=A0A0A1US04_9HYPO|nr:hypothetical protein X797_007764 [Metarhizium robertsii]